VQKRAGDDIVVHMKRDENVSVVVGREKRSHQNMENRHISAFRRMLNHRIKKRDEQGNTNSYVAAEIAALEWVLLYWETNSKYSDNEARKE